MRPDLSKYKTVRVHLQYRLREDVGPPQSEQELFVLALRRAEAHNPGLTDWLNKLWSPRKPGDPLPPPLSVPHNPNAPSDDITFDAEGYPVTPPLPGYVTTWAGRAARIVPPTKLVLPPVPEGGWRGVDTVGLLMEHPPIHVAGGISSMSTVSGLSGKKLERATTVAPAAGGVPRPYHLGEPLAEGDVLVLDLAHEQWAS